MRFFTKLILSALVLVLFDGAAQSQAQTVYVDSCAAGPGAGSQSNPYNKLTRAVDLAAPGSVLVVQGGSYPERLPIDGQKKLTITAPNGPVQVGRYFVGTQEICVPVTQWEGDFNPDSLLANCAGNPPGARAKLYYPAMAPGDGPVACGGPFPLIVYAHGKRLYPLCDGGHLPLEQDYRQAEGLLTRLAAAGIIVLSVDVSSKEGGFNDLGKASIIVSALAYARDENTRSGARLERVVDLQRVGLMGHSTGGAGAIRATACLSGHCLTSLRLPQVRVGAVGLLSPGYFNNPDDVRGMTAPVLVVHGTNETPYQVGDGPLKVYGLANSPKRLVVITGANHYGYTDSICIATPYDDVSQVGGVTGREAHRRQQQAAGDYLGAFFSVYLRGDDSKISYLLQQDEEQCGYPGNPPTCGPPVRRFSDLDNLNVTVNVCSCLH